MCTFGLAYMAPSSSLRFTPSFLWSSRFTRKCVGTNLKNKDIGTTTYTQYSIQTRVSDLEPGYLAGAWAVTLARLRLHLAVDLIEAIVYKLHLVGVRKQLIAWNENNPYLILKLHPIRNIRPVEIDTKHTSTIIYSITFRTQCCEAGADFLFLVGRSQEPPQKRRLWLAKSFCKAKKSVFRIRIQGSSGSRFGIRIQELKKRTKMLQITTWFHLPFDEKILFMIMKLFKFFFFRKCKQIAWTD